MAPNCYFQIDFIQGQKNEVKVFEGVDFSVFGFKLKMARIRSPFILQIYMPCILFVIVSWISYVMPIEGGERAGKCLDSKYYLITALLVYIR
jgi:hypothetical protein